MIAPVPPSCRDADEPGSLTDPRWITGVPFSVRLSPSGEFRFDSPPHETESLLEATPAELSRQLTERDIPFVNEDEPAYWDSIRKSAEELSPWRREIHLRGNRSGRDIWIRAHAIPVREADGTIVWTGLLVDLTELKSVQDKLWKAYQKLSSHMDNTPLAVIEWEESGRVVRWSAQAERMFGWSASEVVGLSLFEMPFIHPDDAERTGAQMRDMIERRVLRNQASNRNLTKDGTTLHCEWCNSVVFDDHGNVLTVLSFGLDVTERKTAVDALARSEGLLRAALDAARMLVWDWDLKAQRLHYSADYAEFFGLPPGVDYGSYEFAGRSIHPDDLPEILTAYGKYLQHEGEFRYEYRGAVPAADGGARWYACHGQMRRDPSGEPARVFAVTFDITERKRAEQEKATFDRQLQEAQKLETLGVLAGGLAHDFNNLLTVVLGNASLSRKSVAEDSPAHEYLDQIEMACQRAAGLCRQMLAYAGRGQVTFERVDLNRLIRDSYSLLRVSADSKVQIEYTLPDPLPAVKADLPQLRQVLLNLVMNAAEAVAQEGGRVFVRTGVVSVTEDESPADYQPTPEPGRYVSLDVADSGPGMNDRVRSRIFEPFFTTKFAGRGLGLPATLGIVRSHRGALRVDTTTARGTLVRVLWPLADDTKPMPRPPVVAAPPPRSQRLAPARETGTALIVDDEMFVREVAASSLEEMGFETLVADDGPAALELFETHRAAVRVAVIDLVMPRMHGAELLAHLRAVDPSFPAVIISGFTDRGLTEAPPGTGRTLFLQKPFRPEELMAAVREVLAPAEAS